MENCTERYTTKNPRLLIRKNLHACLYRILHSHLYANAHSAIRTRGTPRYTLCCTPPYTLQCTRTYTHDARAHIRHNARTPIHVILHAGLYANFCTRIYTLYVRLYVKNCTSAYTLFFLASCFSWLDFWRRTLADLGEYDSAACDDSSSTAAAYINFSGAAPVSPARTLAANTTPGRRKNT